MGWRWWYVSIFGYLALPPKAIKETRLQFSLQWNPSMDSIVKKSEKALELSEAIQFHTAKQLVVPYTVTPEKYLFSMH